MKIISTMCAALLALPILATAQTAPAAPAAPAAPPPPARGPVLALAVEAAQAALEACHTRGFAVSVSVVDSAGVPKAVLAADGAHERGVLSSGAKARTALAFRQPTSALGKRVTEDAAFDAQIKANAAYNVRAGGLPIHVGDTLVGAIGVGGARGSEIDEACAQAGLAKVQARLQ